MKQAKWERRQAKCDAERRRMRKHGASLGKVYRNAIEKKQETVSSRNNR